MYIYLQVKNVKDHTLENRMESFFLAETTKYLYLLFDTENFIHNTGDHGTVINTTNGECVIDAGNFLMLNLVASVHISPIRIKFVMRSYSQCMYKLYLLHKHFIRGQSLFD